MSLYDLRGSDTRIGDYTDEFRGHVVDWDWPSHLNRSQYEQTNNVTAVLWRMKESARPITEETFKIARDERAAAVREENPELDEEYYKTVHKNCVTNLGYTRDNGYRRPMRGFVKEAKRVIRNYSPETQ